MKYVVITPAKNEAMFINNVISSMIQQTIPPSEWIIVDDGSTDGTPDIVARYAKDYSWIKLMHNEDRGYRQRGKGVIEVFYVGYQALTIKDYSFIVKLDADLSFGTTYFESLLLEFRSNHNLGIAGGGVYESADGTIWKLRSAKDHVRGPTKVYRRACFEDIGGLEPGLGWDGIDEWRALRMAWEVRSFVELKVLHHRLTGKATGALKSRREEGVGAYNMGYHPLFIIARGLRHMASQPYLLGGLAMIFAYFAASANNRQKFVDSDLMYFVRRTQLRQLSRLFHGTLIHQR